jgi:polyferredoxin
MTIKTFRNLRRISQTLFLILFIFLLFKTEFRGTFDKNAQEKIRLSYPVHIFLEIDPLAAVSTAISTHSLYKHIVWSLIIIISTILLGRFFCGWLCPLGTLNHIFSSLKSRKNTEKIVNSNRYKKWQSVKFYILFGMLASAVFTSLQTGLLDPISFTIRSLATSVIPGLNYVMRYILDIMYETDNSLLKSISDLGYVIFENNLFTFKQLFFHNSFIIGSIFITILIFNRLITRFWCRGICPLGALLGIFSKLSIFGMEKDNEKCTFCDKCLIHCQGADEPIAGVKWKSHECVLCLNCQTICPEDVIHFKFFPKQESVGALSPDLTRRRLLISLGAGFTFFPIIRATSGLEKNYNPKLIRPPGSLEEEDFLSRCIRCGECMKVCPTNAIHPTLTEAGIEGIWTPIMIMRIGYCEDTCVLCSQLCPTGAIWELDEETKVGDKGKNRVKIGTAFIDRGRCLPHAMDTPCIVCEEHCPTVPKSIYLKEVIVKDRDGNDVKLQQPYLDPKVCWGCGICEYVCPVKDNPAIYVTNIGETRAPTKRLILNP